MGGVCGGQVPTEGRLVLQRMPGWLREEQRRWGGYLAWQEVAAKSFWLSRCGPFTPTHAPAEPSK